MSSTSGHDPKRTLARYTFVLPTSKQVPDVRLHRSRMPFCAPTQRPATGAESLVQLEQSG
jgi:hypothetical protein